MFGGRGADTPVASATKSATSSCASAGLKRRSKPIVVDAFELIALPQSDPATCPGYTSTPSPSSTSRPERVEEPLGALARLDGEVGPRGVSDEERVAGQDDPRLRLRA